ncbi:hypothetical protein PSA7680_01872 [Pseudoruegeria aquimaris]|uniref:Glyoxalase-like domain protein n=1 Tax=Pseudoruegeria aquimaris TaxID=393663 RepID=A0A1Y5SDE1_9RHOB|nr:hypothetical protein [Pseudoruegeria aquimaris]SLN38178.1 hypothetical protein PSA7680_01872 [Pseudoruegeria aquimaris]
MALLGIRVCKVAEVSEAAAIAETFGKLGLENEMGAGEGDFSGAIFSGLDQSWVEVWASGPGMPEGIMLQLVVDDAEAMAKEARANGLSPEGPFRMHGETVYCLTLPGGLAMSFQSKIT